MLKKFFGKFKNKEAVYALYGMIVKQARRPEFYLDYGVDDSVDGRFDMILLHLFLLVYRLEEEGDDEALLQRHLQEAFVSDMDRSLREMGVGDMNVGKQVKKMSVAWFGRAKAYRDALQSDNNQLLIEALDRNLYRDENSEFSPQIAQYMRDCSKKLHEQNIEAVKVAPAFINLVADEG